MQQFLAPGWNPKIIGFLVLAQIKALKMTVEVGFVTGVTPAITPKGSAISVTPLLLFSFMIPTVFSFLMESKTFFEAKIFFEILSLKFPFFVSSKAIKASVSLFSRAA